MAIKKTATYNKRTLSAKSSNVGGFASSKKVTSNFNKIRGYQKKSIWSLQDEGITNRKSDYNRAIRVNKSAYNVNKLESSKLSSNSSKNSYSGSLYNGNAARKLNYEPSYKKDQAPKVNQEKAVFRASSGEGKKRGIMQGSIMSPMLLSLSKIAGSVIVLIAIMAFIRIGLNSATVSAGIASKEISKQIDNELINKNTLEVQDSKLSNSSRVRQAAQEYSLVSSPTIALINLEKDILAYDGYKVSLVDSLQRLVDKDA